MDPGFAITVCKTLWNLNALESQSSYVEKSIQIQGVNEGEMESVWLHA